MWKFLRKSANGSKPSGRESESPKFGQNVSKWAGSALFVTGLMLLAIYGAFRFESHLGSQAALDSFATLESSATSPVEKGLKDNAKPETDFSLWDRDRLRSYKESLADPPGAPMGVLKIPKIDLVAPLLDGTDDLTLNHAVGRIAGTARPGEKGNIGIAGHRDGFFRGLKEVKAGDAIELKTLKGTENYVVDEVRIVTPDNVAVLQPRQVPSLTLVTCYPFYFIGSAPKRYVVMASLTHETSSGPGKSIAGSETQPSNTPKEAK
jgi:sortase A